MLVALAGAVVQNDDPAPKKTGAGVVITHSDITDRKRSEQALRRSEERLRLLTDALPVLISYVDENQL